jgi:hypothetical protein
MHACEATKYSTFLNVLYLVASHAMDLKVYEWIALINNSITIARDTVANFATVSN